MASINIIIVEDNIALRQSLEDFLSSEGMLVRGVESGEELDREIIKAVPDALVMDLNLPGEDGIDIIPRVRKAYPDMGVVVLTARVRTQDRKDAYAAGADVFLSKPAGAEELSNVIHALVRRAKSASGTDAWVLERWAHQITPPHNEPIPLTPSECLLLHALALSPDLLPFHRLLTDFGDPAMDERTNKVRIEQLVYRVRQKLSAFSNGAPTIKVMRGQGYRLCIPIVMRD